MKRLDTLILFVLFIGVNTYEFRYGFNWALGALGYRLINKD